MNHETEGRLDLSQCQRSTAEERKATTELPNSINRVKLEADQQLLSLTMH